MQFGTFRFCFLGGFQRRAVALLGRKNSKKPAVSWHTTFAESLVCYTFAKGMRAGGGFLLCREAKRKTAVCAALSKQTQYQAKPDPSPEQRDRPIICALRKNHDVHLIKD